MFIHFSHVFRLRKYGQTYTSRLSSSKTFAYSSPEDNRITKRMPLMPFKSMPPDQSIVGDSKNSDTVIDCIVQHIIIGLMPFNFLLTISAFNNFISETQISHF